MSVVPAITVQQLKAALDAGQPVTLIDVREPSEHVTCNIAAAKLIPLGSLPDHMADLPKTGLLVMHCHHGGRSGRATEYLLRNGFDNVVNLTGGIDAWSREIDSTVPTY